MQYSKKFEQPTRHIVMVLLLTQHAKPKARTNPKQNKIQNLTGNGSTSPARMEAQDTQSKNLMSHWECVLLIIL